MGERRTPSVQHRGEAEPRAEVLRVGGDGDERRRGAEGNRPREGCRCRPASAGRVRRRAMEQEIPGHCPEPAAQLGTGHPVFRLPRRGTADHLRDQFYRGAERQADVGFLRSRCKLADRHDFDHLPAERAEGCVGHGMRPGGRFETRRSSHRPHLSCHRVADRAGLKPARSAIPRERFSRLTPSGHRPPFISPEMESGPRNETGRRDHALITMIAVLSCAYHSHLSRFRTYKCRTRSYTLPTNFTGLLSGSRQSLAFPSDFGPVAREMEIENS